jgi:hypothetical protein
MISLTRREFEIASNALTQVWTEAHWASLARRERRHHTLSELASSAARPVALTPVKHPARQPRAPH